MKNSASSALASGLGDSLLIWDWMAMKVEIERHKWFSSENAGKDVGWDWAYTDWMIKHYKAYRERLALQRNKQD